MFHFRNKEDVIKWAMGHLPNSYRSIARAFEEGKIEFLGGFKCFSCFAHSEIFGWAIKLTTIFDKIHYLFIYPDTHSKKFKLFIFDEINWSKWDGDKSDNPLYQGDFPDKYRRLKNDAIKK